MLDKAQIPYNLKSDIQAIVEKMGKDGVATLATMNHEDPATVRCSSGDPECIRVCDGAVT